MRRKVRVSIVVIIILILCFVAAATQYIFVYALKSAPSSKDIPASYSYLREKSPSLGNWVDSIRRV
ncbi:MAG: alpha/beta hydrolase, partial [Rikenellaceae bacterium]